MNKTIQLLEFNVWANDKVFEHLKTLPPEIYRKEVQSVFPSVSAVLIHMYQVDHVWLKAMKGEEFYDIVATLGQLTDELNAASLDEMKIRFKELSSLYASFIGGLKDTASQTTINHPHFGTLQTNYADRSSMLLIMERITAAISQPSSISRGTKELQSIIFSICTRCSINRNVGETVTTDGLYLFF
jgi:uncharacterized damage-inducible protein DinB